MRHRTIILVALYAALFVATLSVCLFSNKPPAESMLFAGLMSILAANCFSWIQSPVYQGVYNSLSPLAVFNTGMFIYLGPGNILPYLAHDQMFLGNPGAEVEYVWVLFAGCVSMLVFNVCYRAVSRARDERKIVTDEYLAEAGRESQRHLWWISVIIGALIIYITNKYIINSFHAFVTDNEFDNVLVISCKELSITLAGCLAALLHQQKRWPARMILTAALMTALFSASMFMSRTIMLIALFVVWAAGRLTRPKGTGRWRFRIAAVAAVFVCLGFMTLAKATLYTVSDVQATVAAEGSLIGRLLAPLSGTDSSLDSLLSKFQQDSSYRMGALDFPAAIEASHKISGLSYMGGYHNLVAAAVTIPRVLWSGKPLTDPEVIINQHFGLSVADQLSTVFSSGYADGGILGSMLSFALLGIALCLFQRWIWNRQCATVLYLGAISCLCGLETYVLTYLLFCVRFVAILYLIVWVADLIGGRGRRGIAARKRITAFTIPGLSRGVA